MHYKSFLKKFDCFWFQKLNSTKGIFSNIREAAICTALDSTVQISRN